MIDTPTAGQVSAAVQDTRICALSATVRNTASSQSIPSAHATPNSDAGNTHTDIASKGAVAWTTFSNISVRLRTNARASATHVRCAFSCSYGVPERAWYRYPVAMRSLCGSNKGYRASSGSINPASCSVFPYTACVQKECVAPCTSAVATRSFPKHHKPLDVCAGSKMPRRGTRVPNRKLCVSNMVYENPYDFIVRSSAGA